MKSQSNQIHVYELRLARSIANRLAMMVASDVWAKQREGTYTNFFPWELSVKESNRKETEKEAQTVLTFRYEGGTVIRLSMHGTQDRNYGFQWWVENAELRFYLDDTESNYGGYFVNGKKEQLCLGQDFFEQQAWSKQSLPTNL
ncbi:MAG: hypothetical protein UU77_C0001G0021 [candidate division WWE3 bacterium GW2011_GWC1_41_7]|uniref:Uncharacterized protein n=3 Tax=Katanobacteria TaxID=422282 RepID=A0A0G0ZHI1_UNCKA|nr:MAG: hypothetical protein UU72_C0003G0022 [candidate division WWE3 bacterium GW2011_GWB1_41_6]KKS21526.1 MAG: hypothetical protein UU77_C0001G0021 [candidate division WWE3 bacterium GW2011_GWC1_41_7]